MSDKSIFQNTQGILSVGYIYLILMGILNETIAYNQVDIEILKYSDILDVLLSPVSRLTSSIGIIFSAILLFVVFIVPHYLAKRKEKKWVKKAFKLDGGLTDLEWGNTLSRSFMVFAALGIFGFFTGTGIGRGHKMAAKIEKNEMTYADKITFMGGDSQAAEILGKNSNYLFYLTSESKRVQVSPIIGTVKSIEEAE